MNKSKEEDTRGEDFLDRIFNNSDRDKKMKWNKDKVEDTRVENLLDRFFGNSDKRRYEDFGSVHVIVEN